MDEPWKTVYDAGIEERANGYFILKVGTEYPQNVLEALNELCWEWDCAVEWEE